MKRNIAIGIFLMGTVALSSCSTARFASTPGIDNVYFSNAAAGDEPVYANEPENTQNTGEVYSDDDDDYFYYDDYSARINRFAYASPFGYYDDFYGDYYNNPYYDAFTIGFGYGYGSYGYCGWGLGYGLGFGYGGWGYGLGLGWGSGLGYGGWGYGGFYGGGYITAGTPRPVRGTGNPFINRGLAGSPASGIGYIPGGRGVRVTGGTSNADGTANNGSTRAARTDAAPARDAAKPVMQQPAVDRSAPAPSGVSRGTSSSSGGGGSRPVRP